MKISKISQRICQAVSEAKEAKIAKNFNMFGYNKACDEIYAMREALARYAKKNNVKIDILELEGKNGTLSLETFVRGLGKRKGRSVLRVLDADVTKTYPKISSKMVVLPIKGEDTQIARKVTSYTEDNFLRHFFRNIEEMTHLVNQPNNLYL